MLASVVVVPRGHWVSAWFLRLFSIPVIQVDGVDHAGSWGKPTEVEVTAGAHQVSVVATYRGSGSVVGVGGEPALFELTERERLLLSARNGFFNHDPFRVAREPDQR